MVLCNLLKEKKKIFTSVLSQHEVFFTAYEPFSPTCLSYYGFCGDTDFYQPAVMHVERYLLARGRSGIENNLPMEKKKIHSNAFHKNRLAVKSDPANFTSF